MASAILWIFRFWDRVIILFDRHRKKAAVLFAVADLILTAISFETAYQIRVHLPLPLEFFILSPEKIQILGAALFLWLAVGHWIGIYERQYGNDTRAVVYDTFRQVLYGALGLVAFLFVIKSDLSRAFITLFAFLNLAFLLTYRVAAGGLRGYIRRRFGAESFYVVVGSGPKAVAIGRQLEEASDYGIRLLAFVEPFEEQQDPICLARDYPVGRLAEIPGMLREHVIDEIVFVVKSEKLAALEEIFLICDEEGVRTRVVLDFFPHVNSQVSLERFGSTPLLTFSATPDDEIRLLIKRMFDIALAAVSLAVLAAPMALLSLLVRITSKGPVIFRQIRCGLNGRRFILYKFRSMVENAEDLRAGLAHLNEKDGPAFKISNDPRLTKMGRYLRRFSIDEWPQFWNILRGDMSFVGPRPAVPSEVEHYQAWQRRRLRMRPGLTCLWAIRGRDQLDFETWMRLDLEYIDNWSLLLDLKILLHSIPRVLAGRGAD
jgi:exopolysaccharide biosynthesis polyprenyl glycosylphosphotransferase